MAISRRAYTGPTAMVTRTGPTSAVLTDQLSKPVVLPTSSYEATLNFSLPTYQGGGGGFGRPAQPSNANDAVLAGGVALCRALGFSESSCMTAEQIVRGFTGGGGGGGSSSSNPSVNGTKGPCRVGFELGADGVCYAKGSPGYSDVVQGGQGAVAGVFGAPAEPPRAVGEIANDRGEVHQILRCLPGRVLGKDNMCYAKGSIPNKLRKWPKAPRPPITRRDAVAIRRAEGARNRVKKLAGDVGFTCKKR